LRVRRDARRGKRERGTAGHEYGANTMTVLIFARN
jgi:hypothetical protein